jgi:hypothetical protein
MFFCSMCGRLIPFSAEKYDGALEVSCAGCGAVHHFKGDPITGSLVLETGPLHSGDKEIFVIVEPDFDRPQPGIRSIKDEDIKGNPEPRRLCQWRPDEDQPWWAEDALESEDRMDPSRVTACFLKRTENGWNVEVLTDIEKRRLFRRS